MYWKAATSSVGLDSRMVGRKVREDRLEEARVKTKCSGRRRCGGLSPYLVKIIRSHFLPGGVYKTKREGGKEEKNKEEMAMGEKQEEVERRRKHESEATCIYDPNGYQNILCNH